MKVETGTSGPTISRCRDGCFMRCSARSSRVVSIIVACSISCGRVSTSPHRAGSARRAGSTYAVTAKDLYPDVVPCLKRLRETGVLAGMVPVFLRRGPWAITQSGSGRFASPVHAIDSLSALPALLSGSLGT